ncbi:hypothetical protein [Fischerella major]|uniref:hypothetical protein n=1 Tax=Fischerella major TaxID=210993 RepID=UPI000ADA9779|nr:hypothetical protein [Fischerella major]
MYAPNRSIPDAIDRPLYFVNISGWLLVVSGNSSTPHTPHTPPLREAATRLHTPHTPHTPHLPPLRLFSSNYTV